MIDFEIGVHAVRTFKVIEGGLYGVAVKGKTWDKGVCEARCTPPPLRMMYGDRVPMSHRSPAHGCECGVYGSLTVDHLFYQFPNCSKRLITVIAAEGRTILGPKGLRTERARAVAFWTPVLRVLRVCEKELPDAMFYSDLSEMLVDYNFPKFDLSRRRVAVDFPSSARWWM